MEVYKRRRLIYDETYGVRRARTFGGYSSTRQLGNAVSFLGFESANAGGEIASDKFLSISIGALIDGFKMINKGKPLKVALGRWENTETYWRKLVEEKGLNHLQVRGVEGSNALQDSLSIADEVFVGVSKVPEYIVQHTEFFLLNAKIDEIYFDLTRMRTASSDFLEKAGGYFAREELKILLKHPELLEKTKFFKRGKEYFPTEQYLRDLINYN